VIFPAIAVLALILDAASPVLPRSVESPALSGVGRLRGASQCTAFLVDTGAASGPAYILTNGHCVGLLEANEVVTNREQASYLFTPGAFFDVESPRGYATRRIAYATMKRTDVAVIELDAPLAELTAAGYRPLRLAAASQGERVTAAGVPITNTPPDRQFLQAGQCTLGPAVDVVEFTWFWRGLLRNDCPDIRGGWSGAPLISESSGRVVAILNTTTIDSFDRGGGFDCYLGTPCEVGPEGQRVRDHTSYAVSAAGLDSCFDAQGTFRLGGGCPLDPGGQVSVTRRPATRSGQPGSRWNAAIQADAPYRLKVVREGQGDCATAAGYSAPTSAGRFDEIIGDAPGRYYLCLNRDGLDPARAAVAHVRIDNQPPVIPLPYSVRETNDAWALEIVGVPSEVSLAEWKAGAPDAVNCQDPDGFRPYLRVPVRLTKAAGPYRVCAAGFDDAGNRTPVTEILLDGMRILPRGAVNAASFAAGPAAPGAHLAVFGIGFPEQGLRTWISAGGRRTALPVTFASRQQVNLLLPRDLPLGRARLEIQDAEGRADAADLEVVAAAPGLFRIGNAPAAVMRYRDGSTAPAFACGGSGPCRITPLEAAEGVLELYGTGFGGGVQSARMGPEPVEVIESGVEGAVDWVGLRIPAGFGLRGYQPLQVTADARVSEPVWIWWR
jgi:uncharacterized protein (TIGR03437 family)